MKITFPFQDGILPERFTQKASEADKKLERPVRSFPFEVSELPEGTTHLAFSLIDYDAIPVCSFAWIHWIVTDIPVTDGTVVIPENYSLDAKGTIIQGKNSTSTPFLEGDFSEIASQYVGPTPPDKDHRYTLVVYALSGATHLNQEFYYNELMDAVAPLTLDKAQAILIGRV